jgi:23S rRNA (guanine745-N1)-methyltransferase
VCRAPLARHGKTYRCERGHSFDVARSKYVNLLRSGVSRTRGDDRNMLRSRRAFLEAGHYLPLLAELTRQVMALAASTQSSLKLLDVGCGEGYFTAGLARAMPSGSEIWGMDISHAAVEMASRQYPKAGFAVASARDLPVLDAAVDRLVCIFGPHEIDEYGRVLKPSGRLILVRPGADHLVEIRRVLYRELRVPGRRDLDLAMGEWRLVHRSDLRLALGLSAEDRRNLMAMTPYGWAGSEESRLVALRIASVTAHFLVEAWRPL